MSLVRKPVISVLSLAALGALALSLAGCALGATAGAPGVSPERAIAVVGQGTAWGMPDLAQASVGVETFAPTVGEAVARNNTQMNALLAKLKELGIPEKDIQTSNFSIQFERYSDRGGEPAATPRYRVSNTVQVKIRDLGKVGQVLDGVVQAGANQVWGVSFTVENDDALEAEARTKAMEDARKRAEALAQLANVKLGAVIAISEGGTTSPIRMAKEALGAGAVPISPGEAQVSFQVQVSYAIQ